MNPLWKYITQMVTIFLLLFQLGCDNTESPISSDTSLGESAQLSTPATGSCVPPPPDMIGWWTGDNHAEDIIGTNHGVLMNGASYAPGMVDEAFSFDGIDDYVAIPHTSEVSFASSSPITVDAWFYRTGTRQEMHLIGKRPGCRYPINYQLVRNYGPGYLTFGALPGTGVGANVDLPLNEWMHVAGTFDGSMFRIYINGVLKGTSGAGQVLGPENTSDLVIGGSGDCSRFEGRIDEVEIFDRALSEAEIRSIYQAGSAGKCKNQTVTVLIDIKPGSSVNPVNPSALGVIPVAILTTSIANGDLLDFDATLVDPATVFFGPGAAPEAHATGHIQDVDGDGDLDMMLHFSTPLSGIRCGDTSASLTGTTSGGQAIYGEDVIHTVPCP